MSKRKIELNRTGGVLAFTPGSHMRFMKNESDSLRAVDYKDPQCVFEEKPTAFSIGSMNSEGMKSDNPNTGFYETETGRTLDENGGNPAAYQGGIAIVDHRAETGNDSAVCYSFDAASSNSMKLSNPHSGCRVVDIARTLDTSTTDPSKNQGGIAVVYDARGNGNGEIAPTMTGDHQNRVTDYTAVVCEDKAQGFPLGFRPENVRVYDETATTVCNGTRPGFTCGVIKSKVKGSTGQPNQNCDNRVGDNTAICIGSPSEEIAGTLDASYYKGSGSRNGKERTVVCRGLPKRNGRSEHERDASNKEQRRNFVQPQQCGPRVRRSAS